MVDAKDIRDAFSRKADYFLKNVETLSMKGARRELEAEMGLPERALDQHRDVVEALVDKMLNGSKVEAGAKAKRRKPTAADAGKKPAKKQRAAGSGAAGKGQGEERGEGAKGTAADTQLEKLRRICKAATIGISPTLYRLSVEEQGTRLAQLLAAEGLSISSDRAEVDRVKRQRERARDLEGIDTSNIITSSSRRRTVRSAPRYAELDTPAAGEDDASGDEEENDDDDGGDALARIEDDVSSSGEEAQEAGQVDEDGESDEPEDAGGSSGSSSGADVGKEQPAGKRRDCSDSAVPKDDVERGRRNPLLHASDED